MSQDFPDQNKNKKRIIIACQSTIPHYRVPFYEAVERLRPDWWKFSVVYDIKEREKKRFFQEPVDYTQFNFDILKTTTGTIKAGSRRITFQTFFFQGWKYDLIIVGNALNNISYPISFIYRIFGIPVVSWGHGKDYTVTHPKGLKKMTEYLKKWLFKRANGFFAYTEGGKKRLLEEGAERSNIFVLNNTIDIETQRQYFSKFIHKREKLREKQGFSEKKILLYVGRLDKGKKLDFLVEVLSILRKNDSSYHLILVGSGDDSLVEKFRQRCGVDSVTYHGIITEPDKMAPIYVSSDLYTFPGDIGLGPLQALCYDLIPVVIDSLTHKPEYEYLNSKNSLILPKETTPLEYCKAVESYMIDMHLRNNLRSNAWESIKHLTIENMAMNFIKGINHVLKDS